MTTVRAPRFGTWRRRAAAAQAIAVLGLPFVTIGGESALRLDVPAGRLHAFGASFAIDEAFVVLAATLLVTAAFLLATLLFGRVWCGWACPQTVLSDLAPMPANEGAGKYVRVAAVSAIAAANLLWYFVTPAEFFRRLLAGRGFDVESTGRPRDVLEIVDRRPPDIVILDGSGSLAEAARSVAVLEALCPHVTVVVVSEETPPPPTANLRVFPKWTSFEQLAVNLEAMHLGVLSTRPASGS